MINQIIRSATSIGANIAEFNTDEDFYTMKIELSGSDEFSNASLMLVFYDENGTTMHIDTLQKQTVSAGEYEFTGDFDILTADKCKLFIWDAETAKPLDTAKVYDINMYVR